MRVWLEVGKFWSLDQASWAEIKISEPCLLRLFDILLNKKKTRTTVFVEQEESLYCGIILQYAMKDKNIISP